MTDRTNRYKKTEKRAAYEHALRLAAGITDIWGLTNNINIISRQLDASLSREDRRQVAAKAIRVERGRRLRR